MRQSVRDAFISFTEPLEGSVPWLYADVKGLVTIGIGNLVDPMESALALPFVRPDGTPASRDEIAVAWRAVKTDPRAALLGHKYTEHLQGNHIRLDPEGIENLVYRKLDLNDYYLMRRFAEFDTWPADAQLATHSMSWACGPAFKFPLLEDALNRKDFESAMVHCTMRTEGNAGLIPRNAANRVLYLNAGRVVEFGLDPEKLYYPSQLGPEPPADV